MRREMSSRAAPSGRARVHPAVHGFDRVAAAYERGRPDYPKAAVRHLGRVLKLGPGRTVVDLGSGTGKLTRMLAPLGAARVAVEPTAGMRRVFLRAVPDVPVVDGTAESMPLPDGFADAIVCAQAFHWFRGRLALREFARVLRPGGGIALVWNTRDEEVSWSHSISKIIHRYRRSERPRSHGSHWREAFTDPASPFGPLHRRVFRHAQRASYDVFLDRFLSVSVIAVQPAAERRRIEREIREVLDTDPLTRGRRVLTLPMETEVYWAFLKGRARRRPRTTGTGRSARPRGSRGRRTAG
jgi:SAM-dependent methyltransferase